MVEQGMETAPGLGRLELIRIAESVAHEKGIGVDEVIVAMEQAIQTAARRKYGQEHQIVAEVDRKTGEIGLYRELEVSEEIEDPAIQIALTEARRAQSGGPDRRPHPGAAAADRPRPDRRPERQAGDRPEGPRGRARAPVHRVQGPDRRDRGRRGQAHRVRQRPGRPRPRRGDLAPRRDAAARDLPQQGSGARLRLRRPPRGARAADLPVAHPSAVHGQAVRAGGAGDLRRHHRDQGGRPRPGLARQDRGRVQGQQHRPGRRLRRHARLARPGGGQRAVGREDRHHSLVAGPRDLRGQRAGARPRSARWCSTRTAAGSR